MRNISFPVLIGLSLVMLLSACGAEAAHTEPTIEPAPAGVTFAPGAWLEMPLTESRTQATFKLSDYAGKVLILEIMDPGCSICKNQVAEVKGALEVLGDEAAAVSVDVGRYGIEAQIEWADTNGATWAIAKVTKEFGQSLVSDFGGVVLHSSTAPIIVIDPSGLWHTTESGLKSSETLVELVNQWAQ